MKPLVYKKLLKIDECFKTDDKAEIIQIKKSDLITNAKKVGELYKRRRGLDTWDKYYVILSGSYLYFYEKSKDKNYYTYLYIRGISINEVDDSFGMNNAFHVLNLF